MVRRFGDPSSLYGHLQLLLGLLLWGGLVAFGGPAVRALASPGPMPGLAGPAVSSWALFVLLLVASWAGIRFKFGPGAGYFVSFDITFSTAAFFLVSPLAGASLAFVMAGIDFFYRRRLGREVVGDLLGRATGNAGNRLLRFGTAWLAYTLSSGALPPRAHVADSLAACGAFAAYFLANNLFFLPSEALRGTDLKTYVRETFSQDLPLSFGICALGYLMALVATNVGYTAFVLLGGFVLMGSWLLSTLTRTQMQLRGRVEDLTILKRVSEAANSNLDVMPMVESFTRSMAQSLPVDGIGVVFYQRYATSIHLVQVEGGKSRATYLPEEKRFQYDQLPLSEPSTKLGQRLFEFLQPLETAPFMIPPSAFGLPLMHGGEPFGGIVVYSYKENVPLADKQWLLETCAESLVVALENCFLHLQAIRDPLTGLFNRSYFLYRLEEELSYASRHRAPFGVIMLDLDDFKAVNDHLGHAVGDRVLHRIGELLQRTLRREDVPARFGGDEFIVLLINCPIKDAREKAEKLRATVAGKALPKEEAYGLSIGCSVSLLHSEQLKGDQDVPNILRRLDDALYEAKRGGKNRVVACT